ncbi:MAG: LacI family transcriptional regulator [Proteobacteria bacterium]|nr:LacI family transcriptional regulator [Pseudomonadota bacterium]
MQENKRNGRATGRLTLKDVAARAEVSPITASRALRGVGRVAPELVARVKEAAAELNYIPDPAARALASSHSSVVTVLVPTLSNPAFGDVLEAIHAVLLPEGFQILIGDTHYSREQEEHLLRNYLSHRPGGLIVTGFDRNEEARRLIASSGVPCVHVLELANSPGVYCVGSNQAEAGRTMANYLISKGRRRIAFVAVIDPRAMLRAEGYRRAMKDAGLYDPALELLSAVPASIKLGADLFREIVARHPDIDAIFFSNDDLAHGALFAALNMGIKVPEQISIAGYNNLEEAAFTVPPLTTIHTSRAEIGRRAAQMLLALMRGKRVDEPVVDVGYELIVRESA